MNVAIVGCGWIAHSHAGVLKEMPDISLVAFADAVLDRAEEFVKEYGCEGSHAYTSLEDMLENEEIDVLHICSLHHQHILMAMAALKRRIHVFMEKPPALNMEQLHQLDEVRDRGVIGVCFQNRYEDSVKEIARILSEEAGKILGARAIVTWKRGAEYYLGSGWRGKKETEGGGVLINQTIHALDLLQYFLGMPETVEGTIMNHHLKGVIEVEDTAEAYLTYPDKMACFYATTGFCEDSPMLIELVCENMNIRMETPKVMITDKSGNVRVLDFSADESRVERGYLGNGHAECIKDYYDCLKTGRKFPITIEEAAKTLRLMCAIYESAEKREVILL